MARLVQPREVRSKPNTVVVRLIDGMVLIWLVVAALWTSAPVAAQEPSASSAETSKSASEDTSNLPVSLERIREGLAKLPAHPLLQDIERKPDFREEVQVQQKIDELLSTLDMKTGPRPP